MTTYHRYECKIIDFLVASGMSIICFLAYRAVTKKSLKFFKDNREKFTNHDETAGQSRAQEERHARYVNILGSVNTFWYLGNEIQTFLPLAPKA
jgi:hypothetical protein